MGAVAPTLFGAIKLLVNNQTTISEAPMCKNIDPLSMAQLQLGMDIISLMRISDDTCLRKRIWLWTPDTYATHILR